MVEGKIVALRPVEVVSTDYALQEYGLTPGEMAAAEKRIGADIKTARMRGELTPFTGSKNDFCRSGSRGLCGKPDVKKK